MSAPTEWTEDDYRGFSQVAGTEWFRRVVRPKLEARMRDHDVKARRATGEEVHRYQGRALEIEEVLAMFDTARQEYEKIQQRKIEPSPSLRF